MNRLTLALLGALCVGQSVAAPRLPDVDTLQVSVRTIYPPELTHVEQAVKWLVEPLGYYVTTDYPAPQSAKSVLAQPIPTGAKLHRTMPVLHALQLLIGEDNTIIIDKQHHLISVGRGH